MLPLHAQVWFIFLLTVLRIRIQIRIQHFKWIRIRIRFLIQGFDNQIGKNTAEKKHHDWKISPAWWRGGMHALSLFLPSLTKLWCMLQLRGQIHCPYFYTSSIHICTRCYELNHRLEMDIFFHTFCHDGNFSPACWGYGCSPPPFYSVYPPQLELHRLLHPLPSKTREIWLTILSHIAPLPWLNCSRPCYSRYTIWAKTNLFKTSGMVINWSISGMLCGTWKTVADGLHDLEIPVSDRAPADILVRSCSHNQYGSGMAVLASGWSETKKNDKEGLKRLISLLPTCLINVDFLIMFLIL